MTRQLYIRAASSWLARGRWSGVSPDAPPETGTRNAYLSPGKSPTAPNANDGNPYVTPIGSGAVLVPAGLGFADAYGGKITEDAMNIGLGTSDPVKTLTSTAGQGTRQVRVPASMSHGGGLNGCAVLLDASDPTRVHQGQPLSLTPGGSPSVQYIIPTTSVGITGTEVAGTHGGSFLSALLGTIRAWEYDLVPTNEYAIRHALAVNVWAYRYCAGVPQGKTQGYRWPATTQDGYWQRDADGYGKGGNPPLGMGMGTLLTLPAVYDFTYLTDPYARAFARAFWGFGGYIVDDTHWHVHALSIEKSRANAMIERPTAFHTQMQRVFQDLRYVDNNGPSNIGGGGSFRVAPPAPLAAL